jgi:hypothetical protein
MKDANCGNCKYYDIFYGGRGRCRRNAPIALSSARNAAHIETGGVWPAVYSHMYCGEFELIEEEDND